MNDRKKYILFIFIFLLLPMGSGLLLAQDSIQFNPGTLVNITGVRCLNVNDSLCADSINCNITIINDSSSFLYTNEVMTILANSFRGFNAGNAPNYTTEWSAVVDCSNGGVEEFVIEIGETATDWETGFIVGMVGLIFIYACAGFFIFDKEHWLIKSFLFFASFGMSIVLINSAKIFAIGTKSNTIMDMGLLIAIVGLLVMFLYLFTFFFIEIIKSLKEKRGIRWNY